MIAIALEATQTVRAIELKVVGVLYDDHVPSGRRCSSNEAVQTKGPLACAFEGNPCLHVIVSCWDIESRAAVDKNTFIECIEDGRPNVAGSNRTSIVQNTAYLRL